MKHLFTLKSLMLTLVMLFGLNAWGETYQHVFTAKPSTGNNVTLSEMSWTVAATNLNGYQKAYAGVQFGSRSKNGQITLTSSSDWNYNGATEITEVRLWLNMGGTSVTPTVKIGGTDVASDGTKVTKNNAAADDWTKTTKVTFTPSEPLSGVVVIDVTSVKAGYICAVEIDCKAGAAAAVEKPEIKETSIPDLGNSYYTNSAATANITCATEGATIKYAITGDDVKDAATIETWTEGATVSITSDVAGTKILWAKAVKGNEERVVSKEFTFINEPEGNYFKRITNASQLVAGAKYVITNASATQIINGYISGETYFSTTDVTANGDYIPAADNGAIMFTLGGNGDVKDSWTLYDNTTNKYVGGSTTTSFKLADDASASGFLNWTINFIDANGKAEIYNSTTSTVRGFVYRTLSSGNSVRNYAKSNYTTSGYEYVTLWQVVEKPVATTVGLKEVLEGNVGCKYQINCALRVNYTDDNYVYASTIGGGSTKKDAPTLKPEEVEYWSDKEEDFNQNDWVAIEGLDVEVGAEIAGGSTVVLCENAAFPVVKFISTVEPTPVAAIDANTFRVANFNINNELVKKLWLVAPQPAEHCFVKGYVASLEDVVEADGLGVAEIKSGEKDVVSMYVNYNIADLSITATGWYLFEGIVVNGTKSLELNAVKANAGIETGVEGVEASSVKVYGAEGVINVVSEEVAPIAVYSANGAIVSSVEASSASIAVAPGFYIVKAGNSVSKVTVK